MINIREFIYFQLKSCNICIQNLVYTVYFAVLMVFHLLNHWRSFRVNHLWWVYASDSENITKRHVGPKHYRFIHPWLGFLGWSNLSPAIMLLCLSPTVYIYKYSWLNPMWIKKNHQSETNGPTQHSSDVMTAWVMVHFSKLCIVLFLNRS